VAFCTQNVVPGIDFTNDPLLQGRNFSYLDTQLKRLGSPNFTELPINAPKCPIHAFQQDGHMALLQPQGRANYEPNSWPGEEGGPREDPTSGFTTVAANGVGDKRRLRPESFADHYSQARQFYVSQTPIEQDHIAAAFTFELSKVERPDIRRRMVGNLRNVDEDLAAKVADGLGFELPDANEPAQKPRTDLAESPALSILRNGPESFAGRKVGVLVTDGVDAALLGALEEALTKEGARFELVAPSVEGITDSEGAALDVGQKIGGGPSVLYDAVALLPTEAGVADLTQNPGAKDFVSDAFAHCKFIGFSESAIPLLDAVGITPAADDGIGLLAANGDAAGFVERCRDLRFWDRELQLVG
jgi:catalase